MNCEIKIGVIGGDARQLVMAREFALDGFEVAVYGFDAYNAEQAVTAFDSYVGEAAEADGGVTRCVALADAVSGSSAIILPLPYTTDNFNINAPLSGRSISIPELFSLIGRGQVTVGGRFNETAKALAKNCGIPLFDYYDRRDLAILNAVPTAEGAVAIAMNELPVTIHSSRALVLGYGNVGRALAHTLASLGADVTVAARSSEDLALSSTLGCTPVNINNKACLLRSYDVIFNTVPAVILDRDLLGGINPKTLIIDLASKPGGVDFAAAKEKKINVIWALSLPGRTAPITSGKFIKASIMNILKEEGVLDVK